MNPDFQKNRPLDCDWLTWLGQPNLYDYALNVERDYNPNIKLKAVVSLDTNHRVTTQWDPK